MWHDFNALKPKGEARIRGDTKNFVLMSHRMIFSEVLKLPGDEQNHLAEEALKSWENLPSAAGYTGTSLYRKKVHSLPIMSRTNTIIFYYCCNSEQEIQKALPCLMMRVYFFLYRPLLQQQARAVHLAGTWPPSPFPLLDICGFHNQFCQWENFTLGVRI